MPAITLSSDVVDTRRPMSPDEHQITGSTCLTRYLYNIPPGVITALLPGLGLLAAGLVILGLTLTATDRSRLADGLPQLGVVTVAVAGAWTVLVVGFWLTTCCLQYRLSRTPSKARKDSIHGVQLVAVSWKVDTPHPYRHSQ